MDRCVGCGEYAVFCPSIIEHLDPEEDDDCRTFMKLTRRYSQASVPDVVALGSDSVKNAWAIRGMTGEETLAFLRKEAEHALALGYDSNTVEEAFNTAREFFEDHTLPYFFDHPCERGRAPGLASIRSRQETPSHSRTRQTTLPTEQP